MSLIDPLKKSKIIVLNIVKLIFLIPFFILFLNTFKPLKDWLAEGKFSRSRSFVKTY